MKVAWTSEVHQNLHHSIQPMDLTINNINVPGGIGIHLLKLVAQQLQVQNDCVDGILNFVRHSAGYTATGRYTAR